MIGGVKINAKLVRTNYRMPLQLTYLSMGEPAYLAGLWLCRLDAVWREANLPPRWMRHSL